MNVTFDFVSIKIKTTIFSLTITKCGECQDTVLSCVTSYMRILYNILQMGLEPAVSFQLDGPGTSPGGGSSFGSF